MTAIANIDGMVRVSIAIPHHSYDMSIPLHTPVAEMMTDLVSKYRKALRATDRDTEYFDGNSLTWHLEKLDDGTPIPMSGTLHDAGVRTGKQLYLRKGDPAEVYPELIDDHAEFIAQHQSKFDAWSEKYSRPLSSAVLLVCALLALTGVVVFSAQHPSLPLVARYGMVAALVVAAVLQFSITFVSDYGDDPDTKEIPKWGFWLGYGLLGTAAAISVPRALSVYSLIIVCVVLAAVAVILYGATKRHPLVHVTIASASMLAVIAPLLSRLYPWSTMVVAAQVMALGLLALLGAPKLALTLAKINRPYIAANGESYIKSLKNDVATLPLITKKDETLDSIFHQKERVTASRYANVAVTLGFCVVIAGAAFFVGWRVSGSWWLAASFVALMAAALGFRGTANGDAVIQGVYWLAGTASVLAFLTGSVVHQGITVMSAAMLAALIVVAVLAVIVSIRQVSPTNNRLRKCIDIAEWWVWFLPYIILGGATSFMGLYDLWRAW